MPTVGPAFDSKEVSCPSSLSGCGHPEAQSVQLLGYRDLGHLFARPLPKSHMTLRAVLSLAGAPMLWLVYIPILPGLRGEGNICVGPVRYEHAEKRSSHVVPW